MTEHEWILARLQVEREQRMAGWNVLWPRRERRLPVEPRTALAEQQQRWAAEIGRAAA